MTRRLAHLLLALSLLGAAPSCVFRARTRAVWVVDVAPPAPRHHVVHARAGHVWVDGYWERIGGEWVWHEGYWIRERPGHVWVQGTWIQVGGRWEWRTGGWRRDEAPRPKVRDHRR